jgi:ABC-type transport system involved in cytochrome c biogenesis permease subunit
MASHVLTRDERPGDSVPAVLAESESLRALLARLIAPLASLRLTVVLFALAIFLIFAGTLAQAHAGIWEVMDNYFRTAFAFIELRVFGVWFGLDLPATFTLFGHTFGLGFYFPGGFLIGGGLLVNLLAAHLVRFKIQARGGRLWAGLAVSIVGCLATAAVIWLGNDQGPTAAELFRDSPSMRILWQLFKGLAAGGVLLVGCWLLFQRRAGIVLLHAGVGLMMFNEVVVYFLHEEGQMFVQEGQTVNYVQDIRSVELAVEDTSPADYDDVVVVPESLLVGGKPIEHSDLPFNVEVLRYVPNAELVGPRTLAAIVPAGSRGWFFKLTGTAEAVESQADTFREFLASLHFDADGGPPAWNLPAGWQAEPGEGPRYATIHVPAGGRTLELSVTTLGGPDAGQDEEYLLANINRWRGQLDLEPLSADDLAEHTSRIPCTGATATVVDLAAENPATIGAGLNYYAQRVRASTGVDTDSAVDSAAAYVLVRSKSDGKSLGIYLFSVELLPQKIEIGGKQYDVTLRFKRRYRPYSVHLVDVRKDDYLGTDTPRNYSSDIRLVDPVHQVNITPHIRMNEPLRYTSDRIETFYQSGYHKTADGEATTLSVVTNTNWMIPYVGCMIVGVGLVAQFGMTLWRFLVKMVGGRFDAEPAASAKTPPALPDSARKQAQARKAPGHVPAPKQPPRPRESLVSHIVGWTLAAGALVCGIAFFGYLASRSRPEALGPLERGISMDLDRFGALPVVYEGRAKPFDTLARTALRSISGRQTVRYADGKKVEAIEWLLDVITRSDAAFEHPVFRIDNPQVLTTLGLEPRSGFRYALDEFRDRMADFDAAAAAAHGLDEAQRTKDQQKLLELEAKLRTFATLTTAFDVPAISRDDPQQAAQDLMAAIRQQQSEKEMQQETRSFPPLAVPPAGEQEEWESYKVAWTKAYAQVNLLGQEANPHVFELNALLVNYAQGDAKAFNEALDKYAASLAAEPPKDVNSRKLSAEAFFNRFEPLYWPIWFYVLGFLVAASSWLLWFWNRPLNRMGLALVACALVVTTLGIVLRIYIAGRPPVINLYSSALFIAWGGAVLGIALELIFKLGIGNALAGIFGAVALTIGHFLGGDGDTFTVMQAVLDTNFWLSTHVVCITLGYVTTFAAGILGLMYILGGLPLPFMGVKLGSGLTVGRIVYMATYGVLCFAILFSFVGTVLGGLWADDSWGRFWGWDPKENGALMIVIWNAIALHARWGGLVKERGLAVLAVLGNVVTAWSWFGVNELGVGLHSYGFTDGVKLTLNLFFLSQILIVAAACLPLWMWCSTWWKPGQQKA